MKRTERWKSEKEGRRMGRGCRREKENKDCGGTREGRRGWGEELVEEYWIKRRKEEQVESISKEVRRRETEMEHEWRRRRGGEGPRMSQEKWQSSPLWIVGGGCPMHLTSWSTIEKQSSSKQGQMLQFLVSADYTWRSQLTYFQTGTDR